MVTKDTKTVFLFPGQGAQYQGMALDLFEAGGKSVKDLFTLASDIMGQDMAALIRNAEADALKRSDITQPAVTLANLASAAFLAERGITPFSTAGFSLGEYAALVTSGIIGAEDCFRLVKFRGEAMQASADRITREAGGDSNAAPGMAAVIGLPPEKVETLIAEWTAEGLSGLYGANFNSPKQVVVSGTAAALQAASDKFKAAGARRFLPLQVAGPFHSPLIADAAEAFSPVLEKTVFKDPVIPCYSNVSGKRVKSGDEAKKLALRQITEAVRWTTEEASIVEEPIEAALEAGPGRVLQGLWRDSGNAAPCYGAGTVSEICNL
ncbi:MAG: ACP S-malonyltransferase [Treponema sp.]|jgi:[acyl-carrier-protein] S-malonyltransferase|nr:ACP S-malonyltransferase [Treponema sp.]